MVVLPFGAHHPDASVNLQTMIPKRLVRIPGQGGRDSGINPVSIPK